MLSRLVYGKHKKYGEWLERVFRIVHGDSREIVVLYQKMQAAKEAADDQEYIEQQAVRWCTLALYGFYLFQVLQRKDYAETDGREGDQELIQQRAGTFFKAMNMGFGGDDTPSRLCASIIHRWTQGQGGLTPEYVVVEILMSNFDFSLFSGRNNEDFRKANTRFFQVVKDKYIIPALYEFLSQGDPDVDRTLEIMAQGYDGLSR